MQRAKAMRFPLFIDLNEKRVVVVGAGQIAGRRIETLRRFGARITLIAPDARQACEGRTDADTNMDMQIRARRYLSGDLEGAALALACTNDRQVNKQVQLDANALGIPVSVCDDAEGCTFFFPAVAMTDKVVCGIVGSGEDHGAVSAAAKQIRELLNGKT